MKYKPDFHPKTTLPLGNARKMEEAAPLSNCPTSMSLKKVKRIKGDGGGIGRKPDQCDLTNHCPPQRPGAQLGLRGVTTTLGPSAIIIIILTITVHNILFQGNFWMMTF